MHVLMHSNHELELIFQNNGVMFEMDMDALDVYFNQACKSWTWKYHGKVVGFRVEMEFKSMQILIETW